MPSTKSSDALVAPQPDEARSVPVTGEELCVVTSPRSQQAEQFRVLRNSIQALNPDGASHTLVMTSALRGEGKTVATLNLAAAMTELPGIQVLVVDADLHQPSIEKSLGLPIRMGLADLLSGGVSLDSAVRTTSIPGVSVLGAGTLPKNPSQLLGSDRMRTVLDRLRQNYSYVLIDTPAAAGVSDASLLGAMADGILMVVRLGETPRQFVQQTINVLESLGGNVLGTCLTGAEEPDTTND
jgi:capsular exopolysaccharide synthesis family protein